MNGVFYFQFFRILNLLLKALPSGMSFDTQFCQIYHNSYDHDTVYKNVLCKRKSRTHAVIISGNMNFKQIFKRNTCSINVHMKPSVLYNTCNVDRSKYVFEV